MTDLQVQAIIDAFVKAVDDLTKAASAATKQASTQKAATQPAATTTVKAQLNDLAKMSADEKAWRLEQTSIVDYRNALDADVEAKKLTPAQAEEKKNAATAAGSDDMFASFKLGLDNLQSTGKDQCRNNDRYRPATRRPRVTASTPGTGRCRWRLPANG